MFKCFFMFISFLESVKAKCALYFIKIQHFLSFLINSCFDHFRLSLCSWVLIKVVLQSSFLEIHSSLIIFDYILICKLCPSVSTGKKISFCSFKAQMKCFDTLETASKFTEGNTTDNFQLQKCFETSTLKF